MSFSDNRLGLTVVPAARYFRRTRWLAACVLAVLAIAVTSAPARAGSPLIRFNQEAPTRVMHGAVLLGRLDPASQVKIGFVLPWAHAAALARLESRLYDPSDPIYRHFLTPEQFRTQFAPDQASVDAVSAYAAAYGLTAAGRSAAGNALYFAGSASSVENALHVHLNRYRLETGRVVFANDSAPALTSDIASRVVAVLGLTDLVQRRAFSRFRSASKPQVGAMGYTGTGPAGGLSPTDIQSVYNLAPSTINNLNGSGENIALLELGGYTASDLTAYAKEFGLAAPTVTNVPVDGFVNATNANSDEVTLDIEMVMALAPAASIQVYEADQILDKPQGVSVFYDLLNAIAVPPTISGTKEPVAPVVSISYGSSESDAVADGETAAEETIFQQMAADGQCAYIAAGDDGAYQPVYGKNTTATFEVDADDPATQPDAVAVGGTTLLSNASGVAYPGESTWSNPGAADTTDPMGIGGGGGISSFFSTPSYQKTYLPTTVDGFAVANRFEPDVSLNADPNTGYSIYFGGAPGIVGGTSAAAPLWAAFNVLANQQLTANGQSRLGFINPQIYSIASTSSSYAKDFHDIDDGSNDLYAPYKAEVGYDIATGWGTFNGGNLLSDIAPAFTNAQTLTVAVTVNNGAPDPNATVTATPSVSQVPPTTLVLTPGTGTYTASLPTTVTINKVTSSITYTVVVSQAGYAGAKVQNVALPASLNVQITPPQYSYPAVDGFQMISAPYDFSATGTFLDIFGLSETDLTHQDAAFVCWNPSTLSYLYYPLAPADTLRLGQGYWVILPPAVSAIQTVTISGVPTGGTFTLTFGADTTAALAYNATAAAVQTALTALADIGANNVSVTGSAGGPYVITFTGAFASGPVDAITATSSLTGGTKPAVTVTQTQIGASGSNYTQLVGTAAPTTVPFRIDLQAGWNQIGDPFPSAVNISSLMVDTTQPGNPVSISSSKTIDLPVYYYNTTNLQYVAVGLSGTLNPWFGYWIYASQDCALVVPAP